MKTATRQALLAINRAFYDRYAEEFGASRNRPWEGWSRLLADFSPRDDGPVRVMDVGCGNGRFGKKVAESLDRPLDYHGLDQSAGLLDQARRSLEGHVHGVRLELVDLGAPSPSLGFDPESEEDGKPNGKATFDLIGIFGVLHHLPGEAHRRELLGRLGTLLRPGGRLWASWWMLHHTERFAHKVVPWDRVSEHLADPRALVPGALEPGDTLLSWQRGGFGLRYLHFPSDRELEDLREIPGLQFTHSLASDGPTGRENLYLEWTC